MRDSRFKTLAGVLLSHSVELKAGQTVLIEAHEIDRGFIQELIEQASQIGAYPLVKLRDAQISRHLNQAMTDDVAKAFWKLDQPLYESIDAYIQIRGGHNQFENAGISADALHSYEKEYGKPFSQQVVNHTAWVTLQFPNPALAQRANMSTQQFEEFYFDVCTLDYSKMDKAMKPLKDLMDQTRTVRIVGPGTNLSFSIEGIRSIRCSGKRNIPDGEVYTAPVRNSVNGVLTYNTPTMRNGIMFTDVRLVFQDGKIIEATSNQTDALNRILDTDEGARYIGEFAIGVNPYILYPMNDTLFDEKIAGSFHFTPGSSYQNESDNGNRSQVHWDMVSIQRPEYGGGEIWFDERLIRKNGRFVLPELEGLNPENLV